MFPQVGTNIYKVIRFRPVFWLRANWMSGLSQLDLKFWSCRPRADIVNLRDWYSTVDGSVLEASNDMWMQDVRQHDSLSLCSAKKASATEVFYWNGKGSDLMFQARTGALQTAFCLSQISGDYPICPSLSGRYRRCGSHFASVSQVRRRKGVFGRTPKSIRPTWLYGI